MDEPLQMVLDDWLLRIAPATLLAAAIGFAAARLGSLLLAPALAAGAFAAAFRFLSCPAEPELPDFAFDPAPLEFAHSNPPRPVPLGRHIHGGTADVSALSGALAGLRRSLHQGSCA